MAYGSYKANASVNQVLYGTSFDYRTTHGEPDLSRAYGIKPFIEQMMNSIHVGDTIRVETSRAVNEEAGRNNPVPVYSNCEVIRKDNRGLTMRYRSRGRWMPTIHRSYNQLWFLMEGVRMDG